MRDKLQFLTLFTLTFLVCKGVLFAQPKGFDPFVPIKDLIANQWTNESGLPSNNLTSVYQTSDGYLWITSYNGIHRFDGVSFRTYNKNNVSQLTTNAVYNMHEDSDGVLWFSTQSSGVIGYDKGSFFRVPTNEIMPNATRSVVSNSKGMKWIGATSRGLFSLKGKTTVLKSHVVPNVSVNSMTIDNVGTLYVPTDGDGLYIIDEQKTNHLTTKDGLLSDVVNCTFLHSGKVYIGTINGLNQLSGGQLTRIEPFMGLAINQITLDSFGTLWVATEEGLARYNEIAGIFELYSDENGLPGRQVTGILFDDEGSLWLTTNKAGLVRLKQGRIKNVTIQDGLSSNLVNVIARNGENYYVGVNNGSVNVLSGDRSRTINFGARFHNVGIRDFLFQKNGDSWIVSYEGVIRMTNGKSVAYNTSNGLPTNEVRRIFEDSRGNVWLGTRSSGVILMDISGKSNHAIYDKAKGMGSNYIMSVEEDNNGNIILGTNAGGLSILSQDGNVNTFNITEDDSGILIFNTVIDQQNRIWLCTNIGLFAFQDQRFKKIELDSRLNTETFFDMIDDQGGHYWLTTSLGVVSISKNELGLFLNNEIKEVGLELYNKNDGMANSECTGATRSYYDSLTQEIWVPTLGGAAIINPRTKISNKRVPPVYITDFVVDDKRFDPNSRNLELDFKAFRYTIDFTSLSYLTPSKVKFMYKLEGFDDDWVGPINERSVQYTNLPAKRYRFLVKGSNSDGVWNEELAVLEFEIIPFFYKTGWFYSLVFFLVALTIYGIYSWRLSDITKRNEALKKINNELDRFVYSASHDLRAPLASIMGLVNIIINEKDENEKRRYIGLIDECAHKMDAFIRDIIDYSRNKNKSIVVENIDVNELVSEAYETLKYLNFENSVDLEIKILGEKTINSDRRRLMVILSNLIANSINYSDGNKNKSFVRVNVSVEKDVVTFKVTDNGIGIKEKELDKIFTMFYRANEKSKGSGLGLYIVKEAVEKLEGKLKVESKFGKWTSFRFDIPNEKLTV